MALCKRCALNGNRTEGGRLGVCKTHSKTRCRSYGCETKTLGAELCAAHTHQVEVARWTARAELRVIDPAADFDLAELRAEKLLHAKFLAHEAVEVFFRSLLGASVALYGSAPAGDPPADQEQKEAA